MSYPQSTAGSRSYVEEDLGEAPAYQRYADRVTALLRRAFRDPGAPLPGTPTESPYSGSPIFTFASAAMRCIGRLKLAATATATSPAR